MIPIRKLPPAPVRLVRAPTSRRLLGAALFLSVSLHVVGLMGLNVWALRPAAAPGRVVAVQVEHIVLDHDTVRYREQRMAPPPRPAYSHVAYRSGYLSQFQRRAMAAPAIVPTPAARPLAERQVEPAPPSPAASSPPPSAAHHVASHDPPPPLYEDDSAPAPVANSVAATPAAAGPPASPAAASPSASPTATAAAVGLDPHADFTLLLSYHNDDRIHRDARGELEVDLGAISSLADVKPVLADVPHRTIPLQSAQQFGLAALDRVQATVKVSLDLPNGLPSLIRPSSVLVEGLAVAGKKLSDAQQQALVSFIQQQVASTQWLPASNKGSWQSHSEQSFEVQMAQLAPGSPTAGATTSAADTAMESAASSRNQAPPRE
jgi:hypothetical protein